MHEQSSYTPSTDPRMARTLEEEGSQVFNNGGSGDGVSKKWKERPRDENWKPYQCPHSSCFKAYTNSRHCAVHPHLTCVKGGLKAPKGEAREQDGTTNPATTIAASFVGSERAGAPAVVVAPLPSLSMAVVDDLSHRKLPPLSSLTPLPLHRHQKVTIFGQRWKPWSCPHPSGCMKAYVARRKCAKHTDTWCIDHEAEALRGQRVGGAGTLEVSLFVESKS